MNPTPTAVPPNCQTPVQVCGLADASEGDGQGNSFLGTFTSPSTAPFSGTLYANPNPPQNVPTNVFPLPPSAPMTVNYYFIDPTHGFFIETDLVNPSPGSGQVSFGSYAARTPLCQGCP